jgi:hypothetical protein
MQKKKGNTGSYCVKSQTYAPSGTQNVIKNTLLTTQQNYGKDNYTIDLIGSESTYWLGTESGLLGVFHFDGTCKVGDGSCDVASLSIGAGFYNLKSLKWVKGEPLTTTRSHEQRQHNHTKWVEKGKDLSPITQNWSLSGNV